MTPLAKSRSSRSGAAGTYVALLRGVNVAGKNKLPMRDLAAIFTEAGCTNVRTYIQSGNVVFSADPGCAKRLPDLVPQRIADRFGFRPPLMLRTADELRKVATGNPFLKSDADVGSLHVAFLADLPPKRCVAALDQRRSPGDSFKVRGREIFLYLRSGVAGSKLTNDYFDSTLGTTSTLRNWRTVLKLLDIQRTMH